jgi:glycosyltransferase involved in cell wall biosynthesis
MCAIVHSPYPPDTRVARETRFALECCYEVDIVAMQRHRGEPLRGIVDGARVYRLPLIHRRGAGAAAVFFEYVGFMALASLFVAVLTVRRRYRVLHVNNPPDFLIVAALLPKLLGARVVFDVHDLASDMFHMRFGTVKGSALLDRCLRAIERGAARLADVVITVHEPYRRELIRRGVPAERIEVVMNTVDEVLVPREARRRAESAFRIVYHGTITPPYGVHLLVEAFPEVLREVPTAKLEIYGEGDALPGIAARVAELGIGERVHLSGRYLPHDEIVGRIASASVGVVPNVASRLNRFALSSKLFEYVVCEVPVISADLPTLRAHFTPDEVLFFRSDDPSALANAVIRTARDPDAASHRARAAWQHYDEAYRWPLYAARYARVLNGGFQGGRETRTGRCRRRRSGR